MRRTATLLLALAVASGCSYTSSKRTAIAGGLVAVAGVGAFAEAEHIDTNRGYYFIPVGFSLLAVGGALLAGGVIGMIHDRDASTTAAVPGSVASTARVTRPPR